MPSIEMTQEQYDAFMADQDKKAQNLRRATARKMARREVLEANKASIVVRTEEILNSL